MAMDIGSRKPSVFAGWFEGADDSVECAVSF
jgi:hypothetical protein